MFEERGILRYMYPTDRVSCHNAALEILPLNAIAKSTKNVVIIIWGIHQVLWRENGKRVPYPEPRAWTGAHLLFLIGQDIFTSHLAYDPTKVKKQVW